MTKLRGLLPIAILVAACFVDTHAPAVAQTLQAPSAAATLWRASISGAPNGLAVDEQTGRIYVASRQAEQVAVVESDGAVGALISTPATEGPDWGPDAVAFDDETRRLFVVESNGDETVIDANTNSVITKKQFQANGFRPQSIAIDHAGRHVVSTVRAISPDVIVMDADSLVPTKTFTSVQADILGLAVNETTHTAYLGDQPEAFIKAINLDNNTESTVVSGLVDGTSNLVADSRTNLLYASAAFAGFLYVIDTQTNKLIQTIDVPAPGPNFSNFLALNAADNRLYYSSADGVVSIDIKADKVVATRTLGGAATGLAYDSTRKRLYVLDDTGLTAIDAKQMETPGLPATGGPSADGGSNFPILVGAVLVALGWFLLWRSFPRRSSERL